MHIAKCRTLEHILLLSARVMFPHFCCCLFTLTPPPIFFSFVNQLVLAILSFPAWSPSLQPPLPLRFRFSTRTQRILAISAAVAAFQVALKVVWNVLSYFLNIL